MDSSTTNPYWYPLHHLQRQKPLRCTKCQGKHSWPWSVIHDLCSICAGYLFFQQCAKLVHVAGSIRHHWNNVCLWKFTYLEQLFKKVVLQSLRLRVTFMQPTTKNLVLQLKLLINPMGHHYCVGILATKFTMISGKWHLQTCHPLYNHTPNVVFKISKIVFHCNSWKLFHFGVYGFNIMAIELWINIRQR